MIKVESPIKNPFRNYLDFLHGLNFAKNHVGVETYRKIRAEILEELIDRVDQGKSQKNNAETLQTFDNKLNKWRPRFLGSLAAYFMLSGLTAKEVKANGGLELYRLLWFMGSAQDDLIDELTVEQSDGSKVNRQKILQTIFGEDRQFYQATYKIMLEYLENLKLDNESKTILKRRLWDWYLFLASQEQAVLRADFNDFNFEYCIKYRETQNEKIASLLIAFLNGNAVKDAKLIGLESVIPRLSFRTQIIDDIADIQEDFENKRPSYAVGAIKQFPEEEAGVLAYLNLNRGKKIKFTNVLFKKLAPQACELVTAKFTEYGKELELLGVSGNFLKRLGDFMFKMFPIARDVIHKINPDYSNF